MGVNATKWSLHQLAELDQPLVIKRTLDLAADLRARDRQAILSASPMKVAAVISYRFGQAQINCRVAIHLVVPSSRSLVPVKLPLKFRYREIYVANQTALKRYEQQHPHGDTVLTPDTNGQIDFEKSLIDNVILQIPSRVLSEREKREHLMPKGKGWAVISEDDYHHSKANQSKVDPRLAKLKNYFKK